MSRKHYYLIFTLLATLLLCSNSAYAWENVITIDSGKGDYHKPTVKIADSGMIYICYKGGRDVYLSSYDGQTVTMLKKISESGMTAYEPHMHITEDEQIYISWAEYTPGTDVHYVKYRHFDGTKWNDEVHIDTQGGTNHFEDLHIAVDSKGNVFVVYMGWNYARNYLVSKYVGEDAYSELLPQGGRAKHPDVVVDDNFIYVVWQYRPGGIKYTINYGRKENKFGGAWVETIGKTSQESARPRLCLDDNNRPQIIYNEENHDGSSRKIWFFDWNGSSFNYGKIVSNNSFQLYHYHDVAAKGGSKIVTAQLGSSSWGNGVYYNWNKTGEWASGVTQIPGTGGAMLQSVDLTKDGTKAAVTFTKGKNSVHLVLSEPIPVVPVVKINVTLNKTEKKTIRTLLFKKAL